MARPLSIRENGQESRTPVAHQPTPQGRRGHITEPEKAQIMALFFGGKGQKEISEIVNRHRVSVARVLNEKDVQETVRKSRESLCKRSARPGRFRFRTCLVGWKAGIEGAGRLWSAAEQQAGATRPAHLEDDQTAITRIAVAMTKGAIQRHMALGMPLPDEDIDDTRAVGGGLCE